MLGTYGFVAIMIFSVLFFLTFVYEVARGGLDWGPLQRIRDLVADAAAISPQRTVDHDDPPRRHARAAPSASPPRKLPRRSLGD